MATPITTGSFAKALYPGVNKWYGLSYEDWKTEYTEMFDQFTSRRAWEEDVSASGLGLAYVLGEGAGVMYNGMQQGFITRYTMVEYALGMIITKNMVKDDLYNIVAPKKAGSLAKSMRQTKETVHANIYNRAFNTSYLGGDGSTLIASGAGGSANHPNIAGGTWTNGPSVAVDISEAALEQACIDIGKWTDDAGLKAAIRPLKLIVPVDLDFEVNKILKTEYEVGTANNTVNIVRSRFPGGAFVSHYLTDTDAWFIRTSQGADGMKTFQRDPVSFETENDFDTSNAKFKSAERYAAGWSDPRGLYGSPGA